VLTLALDADTVTLPGLRAGALPCSTKLSGGFVDGGSLLRCFVDERCFCLLRVSLLKMQRIYLNSAEPCHVGGARGFKRQCVARSALFRVHLYSQSEPLVLPTFAGFSRCGIASSHSAWIYVCIFLNNVRAVHQCVTDNPEKTVYKLRASPV